MKTTTPLTTNREKGKRMKAPVGLWLTWGGENDDVDGGSGPSSDGARGCGGRGEQATAGEAGGGGFGLGEQKRRRRGRRRDRQVEAAKDGRSRRGGG
ncbi:hypothetical protein E2562_034637 [Oryza meyeriana var. granulata]|uniref:Uncharacterized protein n=1 Tax=Oryza meyeriana var. granulata TaxID=110450 RepID=A0A6G1F1D3_9ORYZ|nr:hypothetical protein E2562_034637 [Oryza meyeriana var. granulata]